MTLAAPPAAARISLAEPREVAREAEALARGGCRQFRVGAGPGLALRLGAVRWGAGPRVAIAVDFGGRAPTAAQAATLAQFGATAADQPS